MRTNPFIWLTFALFLCGCASTPDHVPGQSLANRLPRAVHQAMNTIMEDEALGGHSDERISVINTEVLEQSGGYTLDPKTETAIARWVERWTIRRPTGIVTYRVTFDARGPQGFFVDVIVEDPTRKPRTKTNIMDIP